MDAAALFAQADRGAAQHAATVSALQAEREELVTSAFVAQEADHLILRRLGSLAELRFLDDLAAGTFRVAYLTDLELREARALAEQYADLRLGLADISLVLLAKRLRTRRILTFDERHFRAVLPLQGGHFTILPADA